MRHPLLALLLLPACKNDFEVVSAVGTLSASPTFLDFGDLALGETGEAEIGLYAEGGRVRVLTVDLPAVEGATFEADLDLDELDDEHPAVLTVRYTPIAEGYHFAPIGLDTDEKPDDHHEVQARGRGLMPFGRLYPTLLDFGPVAAGAQGEAGLTVVNEGEIALQLRSVALDPAAFGLSTALPLEIPVGGTALLSLTADSEGEEILGAATLSFVGGLDLGPATLQVNACSNPVGDLYDGDGDGYSYCASDCDDWDDSAHPGGTEVCDGADNDCDGTIDETTECYDDDGDGYTEEEGDCNDANDQMSPGLPEIWDNGLDDDCDGLVDYGFGDADGDGVADWAGDCDDGDATVYPGAPETADGVDEDCDGTIDEGTTAYDDDGDGFSEDGGDCDDSDFDVYPSATENANGVDDDCDGTVDEGTTWYDDDGDGYSERGGDCDDTDAAVGPASLEITGNGVDDDCDGVKS